MLAISILQPDLGGLLRLGLMQRGMLGVIVSSTKSQYLQRPRASKAGGQERQTLCIYELPAHDTPEYHKISHKNDGICENIPKNKGIYRDRIHQWSNSIALLFNIAESVEYCMPVSKATLKFREMIAAS